MFFRQHRREGNRPDFANSSNTAGTIRVILSNVKRIRVSRINRIICVSTPHDGINYRSPTRLLLTRPRRRTLPLELTRVPIMFIRTMTDDLRLTDRVTNNTTNTRGSSNQFQVLSFRGKLRNARLQPTAQRRMNGLLGVTQKNLNQLSDSHRQNLRGLNNRFPGFKNRHNQRRNNLTVNENLTRSFFRVLGRTRVRRFVNFIWCRPTRIF